MKTLRVFTPDLQLRSEIDNYESLQFQRSWSEIGEFEIHINRHKEHVNELLKNNIIVLGEDLHKCGIIRHCEISFDESGRGSETWVIRGYELKAILGQRITVPPSGKSHETLNNTAETAMKFLVDRNAITPVDTKRAFPMLERALSPGRGKQVKWQSRYKELNEELTALAELGGLGWWIALDYSKRKWVLDVYEGRNLTVGQTEHPPVIFSTEFDALSSLQFVNSYMDYRNVAYVGGQGEGAKRRIVKVGDASGLDRHEMFVDARDVSEETEDDPPQKRPDPEIVADLRERGEQNLAEHAHEFSLEGKVFEESPYVYEEDWDLGDIVTIREPNWNLTLDARITAVREIYEHGGMQVEPTFGNSQPTLMKKIKQQLNQFSPEIRR
ncbi:siphovirus ReqiPepy6 Gp37-like family protein [Numidum massiliense]|uniref:siphovirus ReqiPepy6 Gp37-like family protein n=1 Tax=Numidum massiliense TaxID=1522315 RepID=UPI0006D55E1C|nr:siphovirus ReqiPepy6 Gp37-like family protein [Numidum massiliense]